MASVTIDPSNGFCLSPIVATFAIADSEYPSGSTMHVANILVKTTFDGEESEYTFSGEPADGKFVCDISSAMRSAMFGRDYLTPYTTAESAHSASIDYSVMAVKYTVTAYASYILDSVFVNGLNDASATPSSIELTADMYAVPGGYTEYERIKMGTSSTAYPMALSTKPKGDAVNPGHVCLYPVLDSASSLTTALTTAPASGMLSSGRTESSFTLRSDIAVSSTSASLASAVTASDASGGPCVLPRKTGTNAVMYAYFKDFFNDILSTRLLSNAQLESGLYYSNPDETFDTLFSSAIKVTSPDQYQGWIRTYLKSTLGMESFSSAIAELAPDDPSIFASGTYSNSYREMVLYIKKYLATKNAAAQKAVSDVYVDTEHTRVEFLFVNQHGALEDASALMRDALKYKFEKESYANVYLPSFLPSNSVRTSRVTPRASWEMSSGYVTREWADWWSGEFLASDRYWMKMDGRWLPVSVVQKDSDITIYDRSKTDAAHVDFTVSLAYDGRVG